MAGDDIVESSRRGVVDPPRDARSPGRRSGPFRVRSETIAKAAGVGALIGVPAMVLIRAIKRAFAERARPSCRLDRRSSGREGVAVGLRAPLGNEVLPRIHRTARPTGRRRRRGPARMRFSSGSRYLSTSRSLSRVSRSPNRRYSQEVTGNDLGSWGQAGVSATCGARAVVSVVLAPSRPRRGGCQPPTLAPTTQSYLHFVPPLLLQPSTIRQPRASALDNNNDHQPEPPHAKEHRRVL